MNLRSASRISLHIIQVQKRDKVKAIMECNSLEKLIDSYWFKMSCFICSVFSCVYFFFLKTMKLSKDICSAWINRASAEIVFHRLTWETSQKYNRSIVILQRALLWIFGIYWIVTLVARLTVYTWEQLWDLCDRWKWLSGIFKYRK